MRRRIPPAIGPGTSNHHWVSPSPAGIIPTSPAPPTMSTPAVPAAISGSAGVSPCHVAHPSSAAGGEPSTLARTADRAPSAPTTTSAVNVSPAVRTVPAGSARTTRCPNSIAPAGSPVARCAISRSRAPS